MKINKMIDLEDLETVSDVKGGGGTPIASVTDLIVDPFNSHASNGSRHSSGINICMGDGSVR
jgi:prepilin-type processing-associated H-X9-DG protein